MHMPPNVVLTLYNIVVLENGEPIMPEQPPKPDVNNLPNNVGDCHALIKDLLTRIAELEKQLSRRNRALFGRKSAKVDATLLTGTGKLSMLKPQTSWTPRRAA
jgi:hypothetical protein